MEQSNDSLNRDMTLHQIIFDLAGDAIIACSETGVAVECNKTALEMFVCNREQLIGSSPADWSPEFQPNGRRSDEMAAEIFDHVKAYGFACFEWENLRGDGRRLDVDVTVRLAKVDGNILYIIISRDITERKQIQFALTQSDKLLREVQSVASLGHYVYHVDSDRWESSEILDAIFGIDEHFHRNAAHWLELVSPDMRAEMESYLQARLAHSTPFDREYRIVRRSDGLERWVHGLGKLQFDDKMRPCKLVGTIQDITDRKIMEIALRDERDRARKALEAIKESENRYRLLFDNMLEGFSQCKMLYDGDEPNEYIHLTVNPAFSRLTGLTDVIGKPITECIPGLRENNPELFQIYGRVARSGIAERFETFVPELNMWFSISVYSHQADHFIVVFDNITDRKIAEEQVRFLAHHDPLTELPNRLVVRDWFEQAIVYSKREMSKAALIILDIDHFKSINDTLGHTVGDALLKQVAMRLRECVRTTDTVSRQGGDEFLIVLSAFHNTSEITTVVGKILENLAPPISIEGHPDLTVTASLGVAVYPDDGNDFDTLLRKADTAMYHAKEAGRNRCSFFDRQMNADADKRLAIRNELRHALERHEFILHYQPQVDLVSGAVIGAEALIRWCHPERGMLAPGHFISIAEESGLIVPIGEWVLHEVCRQAVAWQKAGLPELVVAANLSAVQLKHGELEKTVAAALLKSGIDPCLLELELTESMLIKDTERVLTTIKSIKSFGIKLSIDDFGTGYSSLAYLKRFAVDKLKIDQSFVRDIETDSGDAAIVRAIIQMGRSLGLRTIAEGVENEGVLEHLRVCHCDEVQGYHIARPMCAADFASFLLSTQLKSQKVSPP